MKKVESLVLHNDRSQSVPDSELLNWRLRYPDSASDIFGPVIAYTWRVEGAECRIDDLLNRFDLQLLPDASGFICFESDWKPDNCLLLDVFGKERVRLTVPWQLTRAMNPESAKPPTSFARVSAPFVNPSDGKAGEFGVIAWVELAGHYYFELDYRNGQFLWGREIRD